MTGVQTCALPICFVCLPLALNKNNYSNPDDDPRGLWKADPFDAPNIRPNLTYPIINPKTQQEYWPPKGRCWRTEESTYYKLLSDNRIVFGVSGSAKPQLKVFYEEKKYFGSIDNTWWSSDKAGTSTQGTKELIELFGGYSPFDTPKPTKLLMHIMRLVINPNVNDIVLDFYSGSATTAHAVMQFNIENNCCQKFIMVQFPETVDSKSDAYKDGLSNICEIGKERIRRAGKKIKNEVLEKRIKQGLFEETTDPDQLDIGFKVFKLDTSNLKTFDSTSKDLENIFSEDVFLPERSSLDILYEILLKYGVFDKPVEVIQINGKEAFSIAMNQTIVYINQTITESDVLEIAKLAPREVIFDERGFVNDNDKINALKRLETAGVIGRAHV